MPKQEIPFRSIKISLSDEALERLDFIKRTAPFRSLSSAIEECIRATHDIILDIQSVTGTAEDSLIIADEKMESEAFKRIGMRMARFTGRTLVPYEKK